MGERRYGLRDTYNGQVDGNEGTKGARWQPLFSFETPPTAPPSPDAKMTDVPRRPSCA